MKSFVALSICTIKYWYSRTFLVHHAALRHDALTALCTGPISAIRDRIVLQTRWIAAQTWDPAGTKARNIRNNGFLCLSVRFHCDSIFSAVCGQSLDYFPCTSRGIEPFLNCNIFQLTIAGTAIVVLQISVITFFAKIKLAVSANPWLFAETCSMCNGPKL